jgi:GR25 family glycosyltransferase involved in LPS biosynthesis
MLALYTSIVAVISLARRADRRRAFHEMVKKTEFGPYSFFDAFDGKALGLDAPSAHGNRISVRPLGKLTPGEIGCYLSHLAVAKMGRITGGPVAVFEDDVIFVPEVDRHIVNFMTRVPDDWQVLHFGVTASHNKPPVAIDEHVHRVLDAWGAYGYVLRGDALSTAASQDKLAEPWDWALRAMLANFPSYGPRHEILSLSEKPDTDCGPQRGSKS